ncbi:orotidine-5'-phosphate decarboxylase [Hymenobacter cellulosivorans]|uniref:Orotidine-5'-phosphate decarboxylase n=1 Tax=Hymenobacter cellulosivorans TaxID=2932249 RepID=A0ABY4FAE2_9BACT|nr:orotidine-5'-phosphate decarboxylase [Hymenobacter cellulosivorans]UOQ53634.1 orotidine-5'-phosphate decarboxylase [Hymenobacter cellulosivorans]
MEKLIQRAQQANSLLCVGLDPTGDDQQVARRLAEVIDQTSPYAAAFKPNLAFFLSREDGVKLLRETVHRIPESIPVILDGKFGDIANTADHYARFAYDVIGADGVTVNPYMGDDAIVPFARPGKMVFVLAKTSNKPVHSLQDVALTRGGYLSDYAAQVARKLDGEHGGIGLVVGATNAEAVARMRRLSPEQWFLVPGVGAQGGDLQATLRAGLRPDGSGLLINTSRALWQAADAGAAARELVEQINKYRPVMA